MKQAVIDSMKESELKKVVSSHIFIPLLSIKLASSFKGKAETFKDLFVQQCQSIVNDSMVSTNGITIHTKDRVFQYWLWKKSEIN